MHVTSDDKKLLSFSSLTLGQPVLSSLVCSEVRKVGGLCFSWAPCFGFTWPRSSTPPSTHSRPTERFSAASAFQMRHSNRKRTPPPFNYSMTHSLAKAFFCGFVRQWFFWSPHPQEMHKLSQALTMFATTKRILEHTEGTWWQHNHHIARDLHLKTLC